MLALLLVTCLGLGTGQEVPPNDGWVTDLADLLTSEQEASLEALMESYKRGTTHEIALLTVPELGGRALESYSLEVARAWGIGGILGMVAVIMGMNARRRLRRPGCAYRGLGMAMTGIISGWIAVGLSLVVLGVFTLMAITAGG